MKDFAGRIAVVTGGGTGMGRELVRQLVAEGCNVAMCDLSAPAMAETKQLCEAVRLPQGLRITTHIVDVSDRAQVERFRDEVAEQHDTDKASECNGLDLVPSSTKKNQPSDAGRRGRERHLRRDLDGVIGIEADQE